MTQEVSMSWRDEERRGSSSNLISREGRGPLGWGEKQALAMQRRNRADEGLTPGEVAERNLRRISTTSGGLKEPRRCKY
jgi:hypothetical protein